MSEPSLERRIVELESRDAYRESELADLGKILLEQDDRIARLEATVRALRDKVKELAGEGQGPLPPGERPPHY